MKTDPVANLANEKEETPGGNSGKKNYLWTTVDNLEDNQGEAPVEKL